MPSFRRFCPALVDLAVPLLLALAHAIPAAAQTPPPQPPVSTLRELTGVIAPGNRVTVTDSQGRTIGGSVLSLSPERLVLLAGQARRDFAEADLQSVSRKRKDPVSDGALWGGLAGGAFGVVIYAISSSRNGYDGELGSPMFIPLMTTGLGLATGAAVDAATSRSEIVFARHSTARLRIRPVVGRDRLAAMVTLTR